MHHNVGAADRKTASPENNSVREGIALLRDSGQRRPSKQLKIGLEEVDETPEFIQFMRRQRMNDAPGEFPLDQILELPMTGEIIWEIDWRAIDAWIHDPDTGEATQPWITLVCSPEEGIIRASM